jgi:hypothetical protein
VMSLIVFARVCGDSRGPCRVLPRQYFSTYCDASRAEIVKFCMEQVQTLASLSSRSKTCPLPPHPTPPAPPHPPSPTPPPQPSCHYLSRLLVPFSSFLTPWVHVLCPTLRVQHKSTNTHTRAHTHTRKCTAHRPGLLPRSTGSSSRRPQPSGERARFCLRACARACVRARPAARTPPSVDPDRTGNVRVWHMSYFVWRACFL